ncbi:MAG TPA: kynureninase [Bacillota bacterium]
MNTSESYAQYLDEQDELHHFREKFCIPPNKIYFDGHSLGLISTCAEKNVKQLLKSWKDYAIDGWTEGEHPWFYLSEQLGKLSAPLIGAKHEEVIITGSTTTNLHQMIASFFKPRCQQTKILADELNFPSDIYALKSQLQLKGLDPTTNLVQVKSEDKLTLNENDIIQAMTDDIAIIVLPSVLYRSGQILNMKALTNEAHKRNILIGFDLCHSIGAIPHALSDWGVDFAVWCTYKYLNGGPGSVGGLYVNEKHFGTTPGLAGWFGSDKQRQFDLEHEMIPAPHAGAYQMGTPHVLSAAPLLSSLRLFAQVGIQNIRKKSLQLTEYVIALINEKLMDYGFSIASPLDCTRGGHVFIKHREAARICKALKEENVICDFRNPNGIRIAPVALYNTFHDVWHAVETLREIMEDQRYKNYENKRGVIA